MPDVINPYQILGVPDRTNIEECKKAYRKLVLQYHPDKNKTRTAHKKMILINQCMDFLKDPQKKARLDNPPQQQVIIRWTSTGTTAGTVPINWWWRF